MYLVSQPKPLSENVRQARAIEGGALPLPPGYLRFVQRFGAGTYRGWINVYWPDTEVLKPFVEYDLWEHDTNSPIAQQQIGECVAVGTTVNGDFLAVHPETDRLLWLPRHSEHITALSFSPQAGEREDETTYADLLDNIYSQMYEGSQEGERYYEPWSETRRHLFLRLPPARAGLSLLELAGLCREAFLPDLTFENEYTCKLFYRQLGGYIRFNYANQQEVAIIYEQDAEQTFSVVKQWLVAQGCLEYPSQP